MYKIYNNYISYDGTKYLYDEDWEREYKEFYEKEKHLRETMSEEEWKEYSNKPIRITKEVIEHPGRYGLAGWENSIEDEINNESDSIWKLLESIDIDKNNLNPGSIVQAPDNIWGGNKYNGHRYLIISNSERTEEETWYKAFEFSSNIYISNYKNKNFPNNIYVSNYNSIITAKSKSGGKNKVYINVGKFYEISSKDLYWHNWYLGEVKPEFLKFILECRENYDKCNEVKNSNKYWKK